MANIQNELNNIKTALYGKDVRNSIHDAIKTCYDDASVNNDNANMEVKLARGTHNTLNDRLCEVDEKQNSLSSQLEHIAKVTGDLQNDINKYQTIYINSDIYINKQILIPSNKEIVFRNNSKVIANIDGQSNVFKIEGSNVKIFNANIEYSVNGSSPHGGYGNAIVIGDYCYKEEQIYKNI